MAVNAQALQALADEELGAACRLTWREMARITPWGDDYSGFDDTGRAVEVARNYLWEGAEGGTILVEVEVRAGPEIARATRRVPVA